jgi:hypothetical protein
MQKLLIKVQLVIAISVLITILAAVQVNRTANMHYHIDFSGRLITHYHPYDKSGDASPVKTHNHGTCDITTPVGVIELSLPELLSVVYFESSREIQFENFDLIINCTEGQNLFRGRAPPSISI